MTADRRISATTTPAAPSGSRRGQPRPVASGLSDWAARQQGRAARREANERTLHRLLAGETIIAHHCVLRCECSCPHCTNRFEVDARIYTQIRGSGGYVVRRGHQCDDCDMIVAQEEGYLVVECPPAEIYLG